MSVRGVISRLSHDGRGITHVEGKTVFVEGALVGEEIQFDYVKRRGRYDEAKVLEVIAAVEGRLEPKCSAFGICGGCSLQHMAAGTQLAHKEAVLLEQLQHIGHVQPKELLPAITGPSYGYRRKARLGVKFVEKKQRLFVGFREKNGRYLADIDTCAVLDSRVGEKLPAIRDFIMTLKGYAAIPQLEVAIGDTAVAMIIRHLVPLSSHDLERIVEFAVAMDFNIYLQPGGNETVTMLYPSGAEERLTYQLPVYGLEMKFHPTDFVQVNAAINKALIDQAIVLLQPDKDKTVLDLFCGIGNFSLPLARHCKQVIGVEVAENMVARGYENARHNNIENVEFRCQNLADAHYNYNYHLDDINLVLLDPPRTGAWEVLPALVKSNVARMVYVSCNPATLARDAGYLAMQGFTLWKAGVLDMFPHTSHVESIALFTRE